MALLETIEIYGTIIDALGNPASNSICIFNVVCPPSFLSNMAITTEIVDATTDESGDFTIDLIQGAVYLVSIEGVGLTRKFTAPDDTTSANLFELINN